MDSNQNNIVLVKFILVLQFIISLNHTPDWLNTFNFMQFYHWQTSISALDFSAFFTLIMGFGFMQFDPKLTIKLSIFFNFTSNFN
jgi:hypothetical protein